MRDVENCGTHKGDEQMKTMGERWLNEILEENDDFIDDDAFNQIVARIDQQDNRVRQLAEQRAELLQALQRLYSCYSTSHSPATRESCWDQARTAIANATQQRNATGGEG